MKKLAILFLFPGIVNASTCYVVPVGLLLSVVFEYPGPCNQANFSGALGDSTKTQHLIDTDFQTAVTAAQTAQATRAARIARIKAACGSLTAAQQDICNQVVDGL